MFILTSLKKGIVHGSSKCCLANHLRRSAFDPLVDRPTEFQFFSCQFAFVWQAAVARKLRQFFKTGVTSGPRLLREGSRRLGWLPFYGTSAPARQQLQN